MAAFLERQLGASRLNGFNTPIAEPATETQLGTVAFKKPGSVANGFAFLQLSASLTAYTDRSQAAPAEIQFWLEDEDGFEVSPRMFMDVAGINPGDNEADGQVTITTLNAPAETGVYNKYFLKAYQSVGTSDFTAYGVIIATYLPFSNSGTGSVVTRVRHRGPDVTTWPELGLPFKAPSRRYPDAPTLPASRRGGFRRHPRSERPVR